MSAIDQRILIVASSEMVWPYVSEPALFSRWNRGARQVSVLSTKLSGVGMRRRCTDANGKAVVEEMTAWLENIGYEYTVIDGPYRSFTGRIRLQPVPEGTLVNWTIEYALRGALSGLHDMLSFRRRKTHQMVESLRLLRRTVESSGVRLDTARQQRVAMQADPGPAVRQSRMGEPTRATSPNIPNTPTPPSQNRTPQFAQKFIIEEDLPELPTAPPASQPTVTPTRLPSTTPTLPPMRPQPIENREAGELPPPSIISTRAAPPPVIPASPTLPPAARGLIIPEPPIQPDDTKPSLKQNADPTQPSYQADPLAGTVPVELVAPKPSPEPPTATQNVIVPPPALPPVPHVDDLKAEETRRAEEGMTAPEPAPTRPMPPEDPTFSFEGDLPKAPGKLETGEMSIWDVFGVSRPSDREKKDVSDIIASLKPKLPDAEPPKSTPPAPAPIPSSEPPPPTLQMRVIPPDALQPGAAPDVRDLPDEPPTPIDLKSQPPPLVSKRDVMALRPQRKLSGETRAAKASVKVRRFDPPKVSKASVKVRRK